jgi:alkylresorcinol/alkylpyrone synthase
VQERHATPDRSDVTTIVPHLASLATAVPSHRYRQDEIFQTLIPRGFTPVQQRLARRVFHSSGVAHRHTVIDLTEPIEAMGTAARNDRYVREAVDLGERAARSALAAAGIAPGDVDELVFVSSSGIDLPSLDLRLAARLGLRPDVRRLSVLGMGCNAAVPGFVRAHQSAQSGPGRDVLMVALEISSLHYQVNEALENVVVSALFADGAAAIVLSPRLPHGPILLDTATRCDYRGFEYITSHLTDSGFQGSMTVEVPDAIEAAVGPFVDGLLERNGLTRDRVAHWCFHPGGPKILDCVRRAVALDERDLEHSYAVLREFGNMSSPTVLFVLDRIQTLRAPRAGEIGVLVAFGPGLTLDGLLLRW